MVAEAFVFYNNISVMYGWLDLAVFPKYLKSQSVIIAINAVGNAPAKIIDVPSVALVPRIMISPRPPAPTNAPIAVIPMATTNAFSYALP